MSHPSPGGVCLPVASRALYLLAILLVTWAVLEIFCIDTYRGLSFVILKPNTQLYFVLF